MKNRGPGIFALNEYLKTSGGTTFLRNKYDHFIDVIINKFFDERQIVLQDGSTIKLSDIVFHKPVKKRTLTYQFGEWVGVPLMPTAAIGNDNYVGRLEIKGTHRDSTGKLLEEKYYDQFCYVPVMLGAKYCHLYDMTDEQKKDIGFDPRDPMGYFIMHGAGKYIYMQDHPHYNAPQVYLTKKGKTNSKILYKRESGTTKLINVTMTEVKYKKKTSGATMIITLNVVSQTRKAKDVETPDTDEEAKAKTEIPSVNILSVYKLLVYNERLRLEKEKLRKNLGEHKGRLTDKIWTELKGKLRSFLKAGRYNVDRVIKRIEKEISQKEQNSEKYDAYELIQEIILDSIRYPSDSEVAKMMKDDIFSFIPNRRLKGRKIEELLDETIENSDYENDFIVGREDPEIIRQRIIDETFLHPAQGDGFESAKMTLSLLVAELLKRQVGQKEYTKRDLYQNKSIETSVDQLLKVFNYAWNNTGKAVKSLHDVIAIGESITKDFEKKFRQWTSRGKDKTNIMQVFLVDTPLAKKTELLTINTPTISKTKQQGVRDVSDDQLRFICLYETQDADRKGLVKPLTIVSSVTIGYNHDMTDYITKMKEKKLIGPFHKQQIFINGEPIGKCDIDKCMQYLIKQRRKAKLTELSVIKEDNVLYVRTDSGRLIAPLLIVNQETNLLELEKVGDKYANVYYSTLLEQGIIEFLDVAETNSGIKIAPSGDILTYNNIQRINLKQRIDYYERIGGHEETILEIKDQLDSLIKYTHCEFAKYAVVGTSAAHMSHIDRTVADRVFGQTKKNIQGAGIHNLYADAESFVSSALQLVDPEHSISQIEYDLLDADTRIYGRNAVVGFITLGGDNIEDGATVNKAFLQRGAFFSTKYFTREIVLGRKQSGDKECISRLVKPGGRRAHHLNSDGLPRIGELIKGGQVIIGAEEICGEERKDISIVLEEYKIATVYKIWSTRKSNDELHIYVKLYTPIIGGEGSKIVSSWSQKFTITNIKPEIDMPRVLLSTGEEIIPDIVINPLAPITRGGLPWLLELLNNIVTITTGEVQNITTGYEVSIKELVGFLAKAGFKADGSAPIYSGETGNLMSGFVMVGPSLIQMNRHTLPDKLILRTTGKTEQTTGTPLGGKSLPGASALKFAEQATQALHTAQAFDLINSLVYNKMIINTCKYCGSTKLEYNAEKETYYCVFKQCEGSTIGIKNVKMMIPGDIHYANTLLMMGGIKSIPVSAEQYKSERQKRENTKQLVETALQKEQQGRNKYKKQ